MAKDHYLCQNSLDTSNSGAALSFANRNNDEHGRIRQRDIQKAGY